MDSFNEYIEKIAATWVGAAPVKGRTAYDISTNRNSIKRGKAIPLSARDEFARKRLFNVLNLKKGRNNIHNVIKRNIIQKRIRDYAALRSLKPTKNRTTILGKTLNNLRNSEAWKGISFGKSYKNPANILNERRRRIDPMYGRVLRERPGRAIGIMAEDALNTPSNIRNIFRDAITLYNAPNARAVKRVPRVPRFDEFSPVTPSYR